jgi:1,4-alpha-glucan branching enzyme
MFGHAGKKLLFMGQDFAQLHEWDENVELDWWLCDEPLNRSVLLFVKDLLHIYTSHPAMYELDDSWEGFEWVNADDRDRSIFSFIRRGKSGKKNLVFVVNMTPMERDDYMVGVPAKGTYKLILDENGAVDPKGKKETSYKAVSSNMPVVHQHISQERTISLKFLQTSLIKTMWLKESISIFWLSSKEGYQFLCWHLAQRNNIHSA